MSGSAPVGGSADAARQTPVAGGTTSPPRVVRLSTRAASGEALDALAEAVSGWGGEWSAEEGGGTLVVPVRAGLRYGLLRARARAAATPGGCEIVLEVIEERWSLNRSAVLLLTVAGLTSLAGVLWPFVPALTPFAPLGLVLGASAWLAILARLRHQGAGELLAEAAAALDDDRPHAESSSPITPH